MKKSKGQRDRYGLGALPYPSKTGDQAAFRVATTVGCAGVGAVLGAAVGKPALLLGLALVGVGAYLDRPQIIAGGAGMAFTSGSANAQRTAEAAAAGKTGFLAEGTARVLSLLDEVKGKSYVADMIGGAKDAPKALRGLGAIPDGARYSYGAPDSTTDSYVAAMSRIGAPLGNTPATNALALEAAQNLGTTRDNSDFAFAGTADDVVLSGAADLELAGLTDAEIVLA